MVSMANTRNTVETALWNRVQVTGFCWLWTGRLDKDGYGETNLGGRRYRVHRLAYEIMVSEIPLGEVIDHLCRIRNCVNPDHLEPVKSGTNVLRGFTHASKNKAKTHCKKGHEFTPDNTLVTDTQRYCRACSRDKQKRLNSPKRRAYRAEWARKKRAALKEVRDNEAKQCRSS